MSEHAELSKRVDDIHDDVKAIRISQTDMVREVTVLTTSMAALQRRQVEKAATWSRRVEVIASVAVVMSAFAALGFHL
jgi:hypothetical protein